MSKKLSQVEWEKLDRDMAGADAWNLLRGRARNYRDVLRGDAAASQHFLWVIKNESVVWVKAQPFRLALQDFWCSVFDQMYHDAKEANTAIRKDAVFEAVWGDFC